MRSNDELFVPVAKAIVGVAVVAVISEIFALLIKPDDQESAAIELLEPEENLESKAQENQSTGVVN